MDLPVCESLFCGLQYMLWVSQGVYRVLEDVLLSWGNRCEIWVACSRKYEGISREYVIFKSSIIFYCYFQLLSGFSFIIEKISSVSWFFVAPFDLHTLEKNLPTPLHSCIFFTLAQLTGWFSTHYRSVENTVEILAKKLYGGAKFRDTVRSQLFTWCHMQENYASKIQIFLKNQVQYRIFCSK